ncbi:MAG: hypothetical protein AB9907_12875 [Flexilinea sp.]|jgi:hypothetical protein
MAEPQRKGPFYLITGLLIGLLAGLFYGWLINPTRYIDITPQSLHRDFQKQYLLLIAQSYQANEDIGRSYARIKQMTDPVNPDSLREMLLEMETDPDYSEHFNVMRDLINDIDSYSRNLPLTETMEKQIVAPTISVYIEPPVVVTQPVQITEENQEDSGTTKQLDGFYVVTNP